MHVSNRNLGSGLTSMDGTWQKKGKRTSGVSAPGSSLLGPGDCSDWPERGRTRLRCFPAHARVWARLLSLRHCDVWGGARPRPGLALRCLLWLGLGEEGGVSRKGKGVWGIRVGLAQLGFQKCVQQPPKWRH